MNNYNLIKKIGIILTLLVVTSLSSIAAASYSSYFYVNGKWVKGTLYGKEINLKDGKANTTPPASLVLSDGTGIVSYNDPIISFYSDLPQSMSYSFDDAHPSSQLLTDNNLLPNVKPENYKSEIIDFSKYKNDLITYLDDGLNVTSKNISEVSLYNINGKLLFQQKSENNVFIPKENYKSESVIILHIIRNDDSNQVQKYVLVGDGELKGIKTVK